MKRIWSILALSIGLLSSPLSSAEPMSSAQGDAILQELRQIRQLLERQPAAQPPRAAVQPPEQTAKANVDSAPALGRADAPLTLVMYTDYECPFCRRFSQESFPQIRKNYVDTGKLRIVVRDLPLDFHANAKSAAQAVHCAGEQGRFWELEEQFGMAKAPLNAPTISAMAKTAGVDLPRLDACIASGRFDKQIADSMTEARQQGISGTPTFVLGRTKGSTVEGNRIVGALPYATFQKKIEELLSAL